ncbi:MAG: glycosyltransferase family 4 protein [Luteolibacter sp.]
MISFTHYGAREDISGVTSWLQGLLHGLRGRNEPVSLHLHHFGDDPTEGNLYQAARIDGVIVSGTHLPATSRLGVIDTLRFLNREKPDVFLPQALPAPHFAAKLAGHQGLPWIFTLHSDDPEYWALAEGSAPARHEGVWVAVSERIALEARERFPHADVRIIPYGVEIPEQMSEWNEDRFRVVYSGRMVEDQKRISKVLDVFLAACGQSPLMDFVFLGDGAERTKLEERVRREGMAGRIRFAGRLDAEGVRRELLEAQALLLMSDFEGLPIAVLEAMACGVVPVARNIRSGIPEVVYHGQTGILVEDDVVAAADALTTLAGDKSGWLRMSAASRSLITRQFSHKVCLEKWQALIGEMSQRATVQYPLPLPLFPQLPRFDKRLGMFDQRTPAWLRRIDRKLRKIRAKFHPGFERPPGPQT